MKIQTLVLLFLTALMATGCGRNGFQAGLQNSNFADGVGGPISEIPFPTLDQGEVDQGLILTFPTPTPTPTPAPSPDTEPTPEPPAEPKPIDPTNPSIEPNPKPVTPPPSVSPIEPAEGGQKPNSVYSRMLARKFKDKLNTGRDFAELSATEQTKWSRIFGEIKRVANLQSSPARELLFISRDEAMERSRDYEQGAKISSIGAWTIAVEATAVRHGFANVPCAEFMSEVIRQAYQRAGYDPKEDFSDEQGNRLIYTTTASVTGLGYALLKAGWSVWDASIYRAPTGAVLVHTVGTSPSHTYMAAGFDGSMIIDNAAPKGRDLRKTKAKILNLMYDSGAFYLPPGFKPSRW